ncbi:MAG: ABC-type transport system, involved in lipoprotein release, permease component [Gammaproteobacteria bacterium]|jgi:putative ABC transport system permease protein|nr:ABC-type transport system, involved in lipoprotein release, permease component [Gammaproteobacteria bacterium]
MVPTLKLALRSLLNRRTTAVLTVSAIAISVALLLGVQLLRTAARESFANTVSGVDLIVGARSGPLNLLLYSVFRVGDATANVSWASYQKIARHPDVAWSIPISLGDSHRGFRVMGTDAAYFEHYRFAGGRALGFTAGGPFVDLYDAVIGADVAKALGYRLGDSVIIAHGIGNVSFAEHKDKPFRIAGILAPTGTPVDRTVHVSLQAITAIHIDWQSGAQAPEHYRVSAAQARAHDLTPDTITAFLVGMRSKVMTFTMQRAINEYRQEPLLAVLPGIALSQLWELVGVADAALAVVAAFVVLAGLLGMLTAILTSLNERRREMAILRSVGARPGHIFALMVFEAGILAATGVIAGTALTYVILFASQPLLERRFGIFLQIRPLGGWELSILAAIIASALLMGLLPAFRAYRNTLSDGLQIRV